MDFFRRRSPLIPALLAFAVLAPQYWIALHTPSIGTYHDDSIYLLTAKSLAEGHGYRIPSTPGNMVQTKYPVLYPAVLSMVWRLAPDFPANIIWFKTLSLGFFLGWLALAAQLFRRWFGDPWVSVSLIALIAACPEVIFLSTSALSEMQFACLLTGCLLLLEYAPDRPLLYAAAGVLAGAAYLTRTVGVVLILVPAAYLLWRGQWTRALRYAGPAVLLAAPWVIWQFIQRDGLDPYLSHGNYYSGYNLVLNYSWSEKIQIASLNIVHILGAPYQMFCKALPKPAGILISVLLVTVCAYGASRTSKHRILAWTVLGNVIVLTLWVWPPLRFLIPWTAVLAGFAWSGIPSRFRVPGLAAVWALFVCATLSDVEYTRQALKTDVWQPHATKAEDWRAFASMAEWAKHNIDSRAVIQSNLDPTVYLYSGRKAVRGLTGNGTLSQYIEGARPLGSAADFRQSLITAKAEYLFLVNWTWFPETPYVQEFAGELSRDHPEELTRIYQAPDSNFEIYRFTPTAAASDQFDRARGEFTSNRERRPERRTSLRE